MATETPSAPARAWTSTPVSGGLARAVVAAPRITLATPLTALRGVGTERAEQLARLKCFKVEDLLFCAPRRYEDRRHSGTIAELRLNQPGSVQGKVVALGNKYYRKRAVRLRTHRR
jgi:RecG-like helicase